MQHSYWNPMHELAKAERQFFALFDKAGAREPWPHNDHGASWTPAVDVTETTEAFVFTAELPGMKPDAVTIEMKDNTLTIKGERRSIEPKDGMRLYHQERPHGRFARTFRLHKPIDAEKISATYRDGLLEVSVPLRLEAQPRKIPVLGG